jgi:hypothetical protein
MAAMIRMIATTIRSSINEKPFLLFKAILPLIDLTFLVPRACRLVPHANDQMQRLRRKFCSSNGLHHVAGDIVSKNDVPFSQNRSILLAKYVITSVTWSKHTGHLHFCFPPRRLKPSPGQGLHAAPKRCSHQDQHAPAPRRKSNGRRQLAHFS